MQLPARGSASRLHLWFGIYLLAVRVFVELKAVIRYRVANGLFYTAFCRSTRMGAYCQAQLLNARSQSGHLAHPRSCTRLAARMRVLKKICDVRLQGHVYFAADDAGHQWIVKASPILKS